MIPNLSPNRCNLINGSLIGCYFHLSSQLQAILQANEKKMVDLKQMSLQLDQMCKEPCKDTVEIQPITGKGKTVVDVQALFYDNCYPELT